MHIRRLALIGSSKNLGIGLANCVSSAALLTVASGIPSISVYWPLMRGLGVTWIAIFLVLHWPCSRAGHRYLFGSPYPRRRKPTDEPVLGDLRCRRAELTCAAIKRAKASGHA